MTETQIKAYNDAKNENPKTLNSYDKIWMHGYYVNRQEAQNILSEFLDNLSFEEKKGIMFNHERWDTILSYDPILHIKFKQLRKHLKYKDDIAPIHIFCVNPQDLKYFTELINACYLFLEEKGFTPSFSFSQRFDSINICFNPHKLHVSVKLKNTILIDLEPIYSRLIHTNANCDVFKNAEIWNYSSFNSGIMRQLQWTPEIRFMTIGWSESYKKSKYSGPPIYDVLFLGGTCPVRRSILNVLLQKGINVKIIESSLWDEQEKADMMLQTKIFLNIHDFGNQNFEPVRIVPAIAAGAFVITESSVNDDIDYSYLDGALVRVRYDKIVETIEYYLAHEDERKAIQNNAINILKRTPFILPID
jgi:hypothetical protein